MLSIEKGYEYEIFVKNHIINNLNKVAYLWKEIPEKILIDAKLIHSHNENRLKRKEKLNNNNPLIDVGVDILQIDDNDYTLVQCKNGYDKGLRIEDLAGFYMMMINHNHMNGHVYYTSKLSIHIKENAINNKIQYIKLLMNEPETKEETKTEIEFKPYDYQIEASNKIISYLEENNSSILSLPCGTGKSFTSYIIAEQYNKVIMISPLKQFAKQNMDRYVQYGRENVLLLDSDGTRDLDQVKDFINKNNKFLISATYKSVDILQQLNLTNCLIIIDEFHNLSKNNVCNEEDDFYKLLNSNNKFLFMSATPRIYEMEDEDNEVVDLGEIVYNMTFTEAIEKKYICDYRIWLPSVHEDNSDLINEIGIDDIDEELKAKCMFLFKCLLNNGSKKCILYCQDTNNLNDIKDCITKLNEFYAIDLNIQEITSDTSYKNRQKILNDFESSNKIELLLSIRICDECIDIPSCDSIYITYSSNCKIRTIQRLCRCIRTDKNNKFKVGNIYIWCNDYDSILNTLSGIKEYDVLFKNKISVLETNFMNKTETDEKIVEDKKLIEKYCLNIKEFKQYTFDERLDMVKKYIDENDRLPDTRNKNKDIRRLGQWIYYLHSYIKKENIKKNKEIYNRWIEFINDEKYEKYFMNNEQLWLNTFNQIKQYINENDKRPSINNKNKKIHQMGKWLDYIQQIYIKKEYIMKNDNIYNIWAKFINDEKYQEYFYDNYTLWNNMLIKVINYINKYKKKPTIDDKDNNIQQLARWINKQIQKYKNKEHIMKNTQIYNKWTEFINNYQEYFLTCDEFWMIKFYQLQEYINKNNKLPSSHDKNIDTRHLRYWVETQNRNKKNENLCNIWNKYINENQKYFKNNKIKWDTNLKSLKNYLDKNKKKPSQYDEDNEIKLLATWLQQQNYKIKNGLTKDDNICIKWSNFINEYHEYF